MKLPRFLATFKKMCGNKAADQPSGRYLPLANETHNAFARLLATFEYFDSVNKSKDYCLIQSVQSNRLIRPTQFPRISKEMQFENKVFEP
jgi:hypothetical protein